MKLSDIPHTIILNINPNSPVGSFYSQFGTLLKSGSDDGLICLFCSEIDIEKPSPYCYAVVLEVSNVKDKELNIEKEFHVSIPHNLILMIEHGGFVHNKIGF